MAKLNVVIPTTDVEVIGADGTRTKYRKVERAAKAGDIIKITDNDVTSYVIDGAFYEVTRLDFFGDPRIIGEDGYEFDAAGVDYEVYEKVAESAEALDPRSKFAKGDKVRLVSGGNDLPLCGFSNGEIYTVSDPKTTRHSGKYIEITDNDGLYGYALPEQLEKVSAEELAEIEKWAAIGRKVGEFKPGDLVQITGNTNSSVNSVGDIGVVTEGPRHGTGSYRVDAGNGDASNWTLPDEMRLLAPVEQRFDREEAA